MIDDWLSEKIVVVGRVDLKIWEIREQNHSASFAA